MLISQKAQTKKCKREKRFQWKIQLKAKTNNKIVKNSRGKTRERSFVEDEDAFLELIDRRQFLEIQNFIKKETLDLIIRKSINSTL